MPQTVSFSTTNSIHKKNTLRNYTFLMNRFEMFFHDRSIASITAEEILTFLNLITPNCRSSTKRLRYSTLKSFFNYIHEAIDPLLTNPCENPVLKKAFKRSKFDLWAILEKDQVDEMIFRTMRQRDRLMLELMARGGLRVSEVLKLRPVDVQDRKLVLKTPKSVKPTEVAFIPAKVANRLKDFIQQQEIGPRQRIFHVSYTTVRKVVMNAGNLIGMCAGWRVFQRQVRIHQKIYYVMNIS